MVEIQDRFQDGKMRVHLLKPRKFKQYAQSSYPGRARRMIHELQQNRLCSKRKNSQEKLQIRDKKNKKAQKFYSIRMQANEKKKQYIY